MLRLLSLGNLKTYLIVIGIVVAVWFFKDYQYQKSENKRQSENIESIRKQDSLRFASQTYTKKELDEYLEFNRRDLKDFLYEHNIRTRRIEKVITQSLIYSDTVTRGVNLKPILEAINKNQNIRVPVADSTDCLIISGYVAFENDTLSLNVTDRKFKNKSDVVTYWERNQWKFLGIKTRLFGKKKATVIIKDDCGKSETFLIEKRN